MKTNPSLLGGAALGVVCSLAAGNMAQAAGKHHHRAAARPATSDLARQVRELRAEVQSLKATLSAQSQAQQQTQAQVQSAQTQAAAAQVQAQAARSALDSQIATIPTTVASAVANQPKPKTSPLSYGGVNITLGGYLAAEAIYRSRSEGADIASSFGGIPLGNNRAAHTQEFRGTARQSRFSGLVQGDVNPTTHAAMYGEFDFQSAAQTANSVESNSYNLRIRHLYGTIDWDTLGLHVLAGQNWSLATLNTKGITPRNELPPPGIEAQYVPGFVWTRQPQLRLTKDLLDKSLWLSVSLENPQTTFFTVGSGPGAGTLPASLVYNMSPLAGFDALNTLSLNHVPDVIGKIAYEPEVAGRKVHLEAFGIYRDFYSRRNGSNHDVQGGGFGFGIVAPLVPGRLDVQLSGLAGKGVGRYGSSQLPDVTFAPDGSVRPISETMVLGGVTLHATPELDVYLFGGEERTERKAYTVGSTAYGYGNPLYVNTGCFSETAIGACNGNTRQVDQVTLGFWDRIYQGSFGHVQVGVQYSYTERKTFSGIGGAPAGNENMVFTSFRYYPF
jgi:hypothetical protein